MFPQSGSGVERIEPIYPDTSTPVPTYLYSGNEANIKYNFCKVLNQHGDCYCEVPLDARKQIDLVWVESDEPGRFGRTVGIEIKTRSQLDQATHKLVKQVSEYRDKTVSDVSRATLIAGDEIKRSDEVYLFDEIWVVAVGDHERWQLPSGKDTPEDGWLNYNTFTGRIEYEIDSTPDRDTLSLDYEDRVGEAQLTAMLWERYRSSKALVAAESWFSKPGDRLLEDGRLKFRAGKGQGGKTKKADLIIGKVDDVTTLSKDSTIRAIEVKDSLDSNTRSRLQEQLPLYCNSKMFSEVYLAVPNEVSDSASSFLESTHPKVGLLSVDVKQEDVSKIRSAQQIELEKIPVSHRPGASPDFKL